MISRPMAMAAALACSALFPSLSGAAVPPVDPNNMGKGDWIWLMSSAQTALGVTSVQGVIDYEKNKGMKFIVVKCADKGTWMTQFNADLITRAHAAGLQIFGYQRVFGDNLQAEIDAGKRCLSLNPDGYIIDAEVEFNGKKTQATTMMNSLRSSYPNAFIAHAPLPYIDYHQTFPYVEFGKQCNAVMPQCYWADIGVSPTQMVADLDAQWKKWQNTWITQGNGSAVKPLVPIGQGYAGVPGSEITTFVNTLKADTAPATAGGYNGVSFWSCQHHNADEWSAIGAVAIGSIVVDNANAAFTASTNWTVATSAADKYGTNYRYRSTAAVSDAAVWNLTIPTAASYQVSAWWTQGTNRASSAPFIMPNGSTVYANQQMNGGKWNTLGTYSLTAGAKTVKLSCWTSATGVVIADAIKVTAK